MASEAAEGPVHFLGIGGSGMAGLAELALRRKLAVQGSDQKDSAALARLRTLGATVSTGHAADALGDAKTLVYSSAIAEGNVELAEARRRGLKVLHRADFLCALMAGKKPITVAGTHGKSTTSAMITHVLDCLGQDPSAALGGAMRRYASPARHGQGELFVAEADESDGSFLKYRPFIGVLTNIALDHMEFFKDQGRLEAAFQDYLGNVDPEGCAVVGWDNPLARTVGGNFTGQRLTYGFLLGSEVRATLYRCTAGATTFSAIVERDKVDVTLPTMGRHNVQNALCALAVVRALGLDIKKAAQGLAEFQGVERRMARVAERRGVTIFDDYAHNPGKIAACVQTLKEAYPGLPLQVVYQPHRFSRLETMYDDMLRAVEGADCVHVVPVYSAGETTTRDFSPIKLAHDLAQRCALKALPCANLDDAVKSVLGTLDGPAVVLTVGAGDVWRVAEALKDRI